MPIVQHPPERADVRAELLDSMIDVQDKHALHRMRKAHQMGVYFLILGIVNSC